MGISDCRFSIADFQLPIEASRYYGSFCSRTGRWLLTAEELGRMPIVARDLPVDIEALQTDVFFNPVCYYPPGVICVGGEFGHDQRHRYFYPHLARTLLS